jgi:hypothetical protein
VAREAARSVGGTEAVITDRDKGRGTRGMGDRREARG